MGHLPIDVHDPTNHRDRLRGDELAPAARFSLEYSPGEAPFEHGRG